MSDIQSTALTKCVIYFHDGNSRKFYSRDRTHKRAPANREMGIDRLKRMISSTFAGKYSCAIIYDNVTDTEIFRL